MKNEVKKLSAGTQSGIVGTESDEVGPLPSRTKAQRRKYLRAWRAKGRTHCDCGRAAEIKRGDGDDVCAWCALLETRRERAEQRRVWVLNRYGYKHGGIATHGFQIGEQV